MKRILSTICLMAVMIAVFAAGTAEIKFNETSHDFGSFPENAPKVTCKFKFTNTGDGPLVIHQAIASCGCTVPQYPKEPIKPGESGEITENIDAVGKRSVYGFGTPCSGAVLDAFHIGSCAGRQCQHGKGAHKQDRCQASCQNALSSHRFHV